MSKIYIYESTRESTNKTLNNQEFTETLLAEIENPGFEEFDIALPRVIWEGSKNIIKGSIKNRSEDRVRMTSGLTTRPHLVDKAIREEYRKKRNSLKKCPRDSWDRSYNNLTYDDRERIFFEKKKIL